MVSPGAIARLKALGFLMFGLMLLFPVPGRPVVQAMAQRPPGTPAPQSEDDEQRVQMEKSMAKKINQQRHAQLKRDTESLLKLATELKQYVDKSNENMLSLEVVRKAEEIEKLAHNVKEKMKGE